MTIEELKAQKAALKEQWTAKSNAWNSVITAKWVFHDDGDMVMVEKLEARAAALWAQYEALIAQWDAVELQLIELERTAMNAPKLYRVFLRHDRKPSNGVHLFNMAKQHPDGVKSIFFMDTPDVGLCKRFHCAYPKPRKLTWMEEAIEEALLEDERENYI